MKPVSVLTDDERFPLLHDQSFLRQLRQDSCGPKFNFSSGDRLTQETLARVQRYRLDLQNGKFWKQGEIPAWIADYLAWCRSTVPAYRHYLPSFLDNPSLERHRLARSPWSFVSDECSVDDLIVFNTSGTTGVAMDVLFDPASQAAWIPQLESILERDGISLEGGSGRVSICLVCMQESTLTYASLSTYLRGAGILKINLNPADWSNVADRATFLEKHNPEILTGDPFTFQALSELAPRISPKAMVSSAMALSAGLRQRLELQFACPVYDIYSLTECRMVAVARAHGIHTLIRPEIYVELLQPDKDIVVAEGERGEITLTGGINPFLPLIRYRTGDYASMCFHNNTIEICDLAGRAPTVLLAADGRFINNVDVSRALSEYSLAGFTLHQRKDLSLEFTGWGNDVAESAIRKTLTTMFGAAISCSIRLIAGEIPEGKKVQYSSEFKEANALV